MLSALMTIGNWRYRSTYYYYHSSAERYFMFFSHEGPTHETLDFAFYIGSFIGNVLYFDLYLNTAYAPCTCTMFGLFCSLLFTSQSDTKGSFGLKSGIYKHVIINKWIRLFNKYNVSDLHELSHSFLIFNVFFSTHVHICKSTFRVVKRLKIMVLSLLHQEMVHYRLIMILIQKCLLWSIKVYSINQQKGIECMIDRWYILTIQNKMLVFMVLFQNLSQRNMRKFHGYLTVFT